MKKILIIRFSSIGDIVLTTPVIRCLKMQSEGIELHYLTKKENLPLLESNPFIDKIHLLDGELNTVVDELKLENFDHIVDLHKSLRSGLVRKKLGRPASSFPKLNFQKWLIVNLNINRLPDVHIVDRYFEAVRSLGVTNDGAGLDYYIPDQEVISLKELPSKFCDVGYIAFAIGAKHATKRLPEDKIISICRRIKAPVLLLGGPDDSVAGDRISNSSGVHVFNGCGIYNINQSASLLKKAEYVITHDTGLMHIASAFKKKIVSVWGNTIPEFGMYPYLPADKKENSKIVEVKGLSCRPCGKIGFDKCPKKHFKCMMDIDEDLIIEKLGI